MAISPARAAAFDVLLRIEQQDAYASELLHSSQYAKLSAADHGLATELVMGVLRWRSRLDEEISHFSAKRVAKLDLEVLTALRLGAYQLMFLDRVPERAAVHESVELVKRGRKGSAVPFANAVLRKLAGTTSAAKAASGNRAFHRAAQRCFTRSEDSSPPVGSSTGMDSATENLASSASQDRSTPNQATSAVQSRPSVAELSQAWAHPPWLVKRWLAEFGHDQTQQICSYDQHPPDTAVRLSDPEAGAELRQNGIDLAPGRLLASARRVRAGNITGTRAFLERRVVIQDEASQLVALLLGTGSRILDCCAAPGGKARIMAGRNPDASIVALELHPHRARLLRKLVPAKNVEVINSDVREFTSSVGFDRVLADVPCSGTGTLAHNPEIKWRLKPEDLPDLQFRQLAILGSALPQVSPGGRLVYSTCSLEREENEEVIVKALFAETTFRALDCRVEMERLRAEGELVWEDLDSLMSGQFVRTIPGVHPCDGFFVAILEKS
jgi:16S rRNA (cytosine967-C5)-methyltransferase